MINTVIVIDPIIESKLISNLVNLKFLDIQKRNPAL